METVNNAFGRVVVNNRVCFKDEKNRSKLIKYLDRVGTYNGYDNNMALRVFVDEDNDFCAFEALDYRICFLATNHKLVEMFSDWHIIEPITINQLRSMIAITE